MSPSLRLYLTLSSIRRMLSVFGNDDAAEALDILTMYGWDNACREIDRTMCNADETPELLEGILDNHAARLNASEKAVAEHLQRIGYLYAKRLNQTTPKG